MGLNFDFATATRIIFGNHTSKKLPELLSGMGTRLLIVTGNNAERHRFIVDLLKQADFKVTFFTIPSEPTIEIIDKGIEMARNKKCQVVVGLGGGSVIDGAKAIAAMVPNQGELMDYLEVIGGGQILSEPPLPYIAIPTTAGTGAEVTKNAVIKSTVQNVKVSLRSNLMYPNIALVDPILTLSLPTEVTATTGVDALTHLLETFVSIKANAFIDMFCREGMRRISNSLIQVFENCENLSAREDMAMASMLGGMALANVKLGAVHGFAGPMGGKYPIPHGTVCACLLPAVMQMNVQILTEHRSENQLAKYHEVARILTGKSNANALDGIHWIQELVERVQIPSLSNFGIEPGDFNLLAKKAKMASSMKGNPVILNDEQLIDILNKSF